MFAKVDSFPNRRMYLGACVNANVAQRLIDESPSTPVAVRNSCHFAALAFRQLRRAISKPAKRPVPNCLADGEKDGVWFEWVS